MKRTILLTASLAHRLLALIFGILRDAASAAEAPGDPYGSDKPLDCKFGEYNYRTHGLDDGTDPYGWYEEDM